ncbi:MAG: hypothetical protein ABIQ30_14190 [Devosia sp.]
MLKSLAVLLSCVSVVSPVLASESIFKSPSYARKFLDLHKDGPGWLQLQADGPRSWIYFPMLLQARCATSEIRYSVNSDALDQVFAQPMCDLTMPAGLPEDTKLSAISVSLGPPPVETVSVQVVFNDGSKSDVLTYTPCPDIGRGVCAVRLQ